MKKTPNPGSEQAVSQGCICPILDNGHGEGRGGAFYINNDCLLHGDKKPVLPDTSNIFDISELAEMIAKSITQKTDGADKKCRVPVKDYPKTKALYVREKKNGAYTVTEEILEGSEWVFDKGVQATDKLHGTNVCVVLDSNGEILAIDNRTQRLQDGIGFDVRGSKDQARAVLGVLEAVRRGWFKDIHLEKDFTRVYGELIGPGINGNLHEIGHVTFVPFQHLRKSCSWKSWIENRYPKDFDSISEWFKELPSLFSEKYCKKKVLAEGLVFWHPDGRVCKLRRDMYDWFKGKRH